MAYYDYECKKCGKQFTVAQTFREYDQHRAPKCPDCGSKEVERVVREVHVKTARKS